MKDSKNTGYLIMKEYLTEADYTELAALQSTVKEEGINLKLELSYKMSLLETKESAVMAPSCMKEYIYYAGNNPVSYLGICSFGGGIYELNGMTHPDYRGKGIFHGLFAHAAAECKRYGKEKLLLLTDGNSEAGIRFIESAGGTYSFSEHRMILPASENVLANNSPASEQQITLREATSEDAPLIRKHDRILYSEEGEPECEDSSENGESNQDSGLLANTYLVELKGECLGKIRIEFSEKEGFIYGFGILPQYRGKGYGKAALREALKLIFDKGMPRAALDVEAKNDRALSIYKGCGFRAVSEMRYYEVEV